MKINTLHLLRILRLSLVTLSFIIWPTKVYSSIDFYAECETGQWLYYIVTDSISHNVELSQPYPNWQSFSEPEGDVLLPTLVLHEGIEYTVTSIGSCAFNYCNEMNPLNIPVTVTHIGRQAFDYTEWYNSQSDGVLYFDNCCLGYKGNMPTGTLSIHEGTRVIADNSFLNCDNLTGDLIIPNSVVTIGFQAFKGCSGFTGELSLGNSIIMICGSAFEGCKHLTGNLVLPNSITTIYGSTFADCSRFTGDLIIPDSVREIFGSAFKNCSGFTGNLTIGNSVTEIGDMAFQNCRGFSSILTIGDSVEKLGEYVFQYCTGFSEVHYNASSQVELVSYINTPFDNCSGNLVISENVTSIPDCIFRNSRFTGDITIPNSVNKIGFYSFDGCNLISGCITIPRSVIEIGWGAFEGCSNAREIRFESSNCADLSSSFPSFRNCSGTVIIGENVTRIPSYLFADSKIQGSLMIPNSVTSIGDFAFCNCNKLTGNLIIGNMVREIGNKAFYGCNGFSTVTALGTIPPTLGNEVFTGTINDKLFVLCDNKDLFVNSEWSDYFGIQNIEEDCSFHTISVNNGENIGGTVQPSVTSAMMGTIVSILITQNSGFVISDIIVRNSYDENLVIPVVNNKFVMPNFDVTITPVFLHTAINENNCLSVTIYPNPTNNHITIEATDLMHITISNLFGQILYECKASGNEFKYDFDQQREGIYLIHIRTANGVVTKCVTVTR